jgi:hypothetical protein
VSFRNLTVTVFAAPPPPPNVLLPTTTCPGVAVGVGDVVRGVPGIVFRNGHAREKNEKFQKWLKLRGEKSEEDK